MQASGAPHPEMGQAGAASDTPQTVYTIGHSSRTVLELVALLRQQGVRLLVDVRTNPRSRSNPQHNREALSAEMPAHGIRYRWHGRELGGLRSRDKALGDLNAGWDDPAFQGYADYMQTAKFQEGVRQLLEVAAAEGPACLMCAETVYWQCHRCLLCDALTARGVRVLHIITKDKLPYPHKITSFARIEGEAVTYPPGQAAATGVAAGSSKSKPAAADEKQPRIDVFFKPGAEGDPGGVPPAAGAGAAKAKPVGGGDKQRRINTFFKPPVGQKRAQPEEPCC